MPVARDLHVNWTQPCHCGATNLDAMVTVGMNFLTVHKLAVVARNPR